MIQLEIWFDRALGTPFELELSRQPQTYEFERREATTFKRRTATPWLVYIFRDCDGVPTEVINIAEAVEERYRKPVRIYPMILNTAPAQSTSD